MPIKQFIRHQYGDEAIELVNQISKCEAKYIHVSNNLTFLMRCRDSDIVPKGLILKSSVKSTAVDRILKKASLCLVRERINQANQC